MNLAKLIADYVRDQWINFQRSLSEPQAKAELLTGAMASFTEPGTTKPISTYMDAEHTIANTNPVIANANGEFSPIHLDTSKVTSMTIRSRDGEPLFYVKDARDYCD